MAANNFLFKNANDLRELVDLNDYLKSLYKEDSTMKFPSIVVVGDQSHGKTSLIENITNLNLPRGTGIQTRVPQEIQLRNAINPHYTIKYRPRGETEFKVVEFNEENLEEKMRRIQIEVTGNETDIADDLITLTIERPDLLPLTIIDLPGFIFQRIDDNGTNESEISVTMRNLYTKFIAQEQNVVVCVLNAANDIENSAVLKLCLELDTNRTRTVVVVTKIDLRTSAGYENYRKGAVKFKLRKLFFTRNKTDEERIARVKSDQVRENERKFIAGHKELSRFPDDMKGVVALRSYLVELQKELIVPSIRANYDKIVAMLKEKQKEQEEVGQTIDRPTESKHFIKSRLRIIFDEIKELYYNLNVNTQSDNYYTRDHKVGETGTFEAVLTSKKIQVLYTIEEIEDQIHINFVKGLREALYVEVMNKKKERWNPNIDLENPEPIVISKNDFNIGFRFLSDKDFMYFRERIFNLYKNFSIQYGLDYFISEQFMQVYENHERAINTTNSLPDRDFSQLAESILFKDIVPKLTYEVEQFKEHAIRFAHQILIVRVNAQFKNYPNLRALLTRTIEKHLVEPVGMVSEVVEVLCENSFKISTTDRMYNYKVDYLKSLFKQGGIDASNDFLKIVCGDLDYTRLRETYMSNKKVYKNALRVWAYISNVYPALKDNVVKALQNHLIQKPINDLDYALQAIFDDNFFNNQTEVARMMRPNPNLFKRQEALKAEIDKMLDGLERIKNMPNKYPHLQKDFDFLQEGEYDNVMKGRGEAGEADAPYYAGEQMGKGPSQQSFAAKSDIRTVKNQPYGGDRSQQGQERSFAQGDQGFNKFPPQAGTQGREPPTQQPPREPKDSAKDANRSRQMLTE